jgi:hypothetical protein
MELLVKPEILTSCIYMDLRLATLKAASFYSLHCVSTLNQCRKLSCGTVVCKHFDSYQGYPNYRWDLIRYAKCLIKLFFLINYYSGLSFKKQKKFPQYTLSKIFLNPPYHSQVIRFERMDGRTAITKLILTLSKMYEAPN